MKLTFKMVVALGVIALLSGAVLSTLNQWAEPKIEKKRRGRIVTAVNQLFPGQPDFKRIATYGDNLPIYACLNSSGEFLGYAFQATGTGYSEEILILAALRKNLEQLGGIFILEQAETPGLGGRIREYNPDLPPRDRASRGELKKYRFRNWFEGVEFFPRIGLAKNSPRENEVQAITGATISSRSVVNIINRALPGVTEKISKFREENGR